MRLRIAHSSVFRYDPPATGVIQVLRLTPRNYEGQYIVGWRIEVTPDVRLAAHDDAFGNITHVFTAGGPLDELRVEVEGQVETQHTDGIVRGTVERFPPSLYLRDTVLTQADAAIHGFAETVRAASGGNILAELHGLLDRLHEDMSHDETARDETERPTAAVQAAKAFSIKHGTARDLTHIFIGAAHSLGIPARFISGYARSAEAGTAHDRSHAWAEALVPDLGWVGFDPANGFCPTDGHIRVAVGLDALGAAPMRGTRLGSGGETLAIAVKVDQ
jgi:transglutaminase-like putative cysteine protease